MRFVGKRSAKHFDSPCLLEKSNSPQRPWKNPTFPQSEKSGKRHEQSGKPIHPNAGEHLVIPAEIANQTWLYRSPKQKQNEFESRQKAKLMPSMQRWEPKRKALWDSDPNKLKATSEVGSAAGGGILQSLPLPIKLEENFQNLYRTQVEAVKKY